MEISVIVAYYNNLPNLEMILESLERQTCEDFEVIVAEDDNNPDTARFLDAARSNHFYPIHHVDQEEKKGFRKTMVLNRAIRISGGRILVFIDGDCIPHPNHLRAYFRMSREGTFLYGRRVLLGQRISCRILKERSLRPLGTLSLLFSDSRNMKEGIYWPLFGLHLSNRKLSGCNWGICKVDLLKVNGFDEDYSRPGVGEDFDIEWRLKSAGLKMRSIRNRANVYHLYHPKPASREEDSQVNTSLMEQKKAANQLFCLNGLEKVR
jgi:glycosyltransferase involved in cell wall biosynthesis